MFFTTKTPKFGQSIPDPTQEAIENTFNLRQVSLEDAMRYGGSITRQAIGAMNFHGDRKNIIVDTKVHFLLKGMCPSIPGWHTDGVPRGEDLNPAGKGDPVLSALESGAVTAPRYHLLVTGTHCPTLFLNTRVWLKDSYLVEGGARNLYANMTKIMQFLRTNHEFLDNDFVETPASTVVEWDWKNIHTAQLATGRGWRYLIRVTETDHIEPRTNPADFIRTQNNVYSPIEFGW